MNKNSARVWVRARTMFARMKTISLYCIVGFGGYNILYCCFWELQYIDNILYNIFDSIITEKYICHTFTPKKLGRNLGIDGILIPRAIQSAKAPKTIQ